MIRRWFDWFVVDAEEPLVWLLVPDDHEKRVLWCWIDGLDESL